MTAFVDTNVLVYAVDAHDRTKHDTARAALTKLWESDDGVVSTQVLQEFYSVATTKLRSVMRPAQARRVVADYAEWCSVQTTAQLIVSASHLSEEHTIGFWDALIVEAALLAGAQTLLSEDLQHGRRFGTVTVHNPFLDAG